MYINSYFKEVILHLAILLSHYYYLIHFSLKNDDVSTHYTKYCMKHC